MPDLDGEDATGMQKAVRAAAELGFERTCIPAAFEHACRQGDRRAAELAEMLLASGVPDVNARPL